MRFVVDQAGDLSAVAARSPPHFSGSFKEAFGERPHACVIKRRPERACHSMVPTSETPSEIAQSTSFVVATFTRAQVRRLPTDGRHAREIRDLG
jgi:AraC-like DNA-binding protein